MFFTFFCYLYLPHYNTNLQGSTINKVKYNFEDGEDVSSNKIWVKGEKLRKPCIVFKWKTTLYATQCPLRSIFFMITGEWTLWRQQAAYFWKKFKMRYNLKFCVQFCFVLNKLILRTGHLLKFNGGMSLPVYFFFTKF